MSEMFSKFWETSIVCFHKHVKICAFKTTKDPSKTIKTIKITFCFFFIINETPSLYKIIFTQNLCQHKSFSIYAQKIKRKSDVLCKKCVIKLVFRYFNSFWRKRKLFLSKCVYSNKIAAELMELCIYVITILFNLKA